MPVKYLTSTDLPRTSEVIQSGIRQGVASAISVGFWSLAAPEDRFAFFEGRRRIHPSEQPLLSSTPFDVASLTKVLATASLFARCVDRGWVKWEEPVAKFLPSADSRLRFSHLLSHTSGLPAWKPFFELMIRDFGTPELHRFSVAERQSKMKEWVLATPLEEEPGKRCLYSDLGFMMLGFALEVLLNAPFDELVRKYVWQEMGLDSTFFFRTDQAPSALQQEEFAATEDCPWRKTVLQGQSHDDNVWAMGGYGGHAGAFSTTDDILKHLQQLRSGYLSTKILHAMWAPWQQSGRTLGWDIPSPKSSSGRFFSEKSVGHLGFTGCSLWIDLAKGFAITLLANRVHPSRENLKIKDFRPLLHDALYLDAVSSGFFK